MALNWKTATEYNFNGFEIEKSFDGASFNYLTKIAAKGSNIENNYAAVDAKPYPNFTYYRLKMIDRDGSFNYSAIVKVKTFTKSIAVTKIFPNPTQDNLNLELLAETKQQIRLEAFDIAGKKVANFELSIEKGLNKKQVSLSKLANGTYFIQAKDEAGNVIEETKIIKN